MSMYKMAVIGDKDSILGFKTLGVSTFTVNNTDEALAALKQTARQRYAVVFITEMLAQHLSDSIDDMNKRLLPAVVLIPNNKGTLGIGMQRIKRNVEKAIGADILFGKEG